MIVGHIGGGGTPYEIQKSLRFRASASAYLSRTPGSAGDRQKWTWCGWLKRGALSTGTADPVFSGPYSTVTGGSHISFTTNFQLTFYQNNSGSVVINYTSTPVFRDPSAFGMLLIKFDSTAASGERIAVFLNNQRIPMTGTEPPLNHATFFVNSTQTHYIATTSVNGTPSNFLDGYLSEINFIDGQALGPENFGEVSAETGQWVPKKYTGTYGTNGFYLDFNDGSLLANLTADKSGNGNNWTANNISLTTGATYDWMDDTPTNNFATLNPLNQSVVNVAASVLLSGNLQLNSGSGANAYGGYYSTFSLSIPMYCELQPILNNAAVSLGVVKAGHRNTTTYLTPSIYFICLPASSSIYINGAAFQTGLAAITSSDVLGMSFDPHTGALKFYRNGSQIGADLTTQVDDYCVSAYSQTSAGGAGSACYVNFGQHPFDYAPPDGFKALCTKNLPTPSILNPKLHFDVVLATGANIKTTSEDVSPDNFFEWIKDRANSNNHQLIDTVRGSSSVLQSNTTDAETTYVAPAGSSVGWVWKAGGAPVTNNAGSIQSQTSVNHQAGFSIVTYTGTGANGTVGHGLGVAPKMVIAKNRNPAGAFAWGVWHAALTGSEYLILNGTAAKGTLATLWNSTIPTSSVFSLGSNQTANESTKGHVAYCFAEIPGFSRIGSYTGNGSADGPFVWCGFKPKFVMIKRIDNSGNWTIQDTSRSPLNPSGIVLYPNVVNADTVSNVMDISSNGFKLRNTTTEQNGSGATYIFIAFAEAPFNYATAR